MTTDERWVINAAPTGRFPAPRFGEPWHQRELLWFFAVRDLKVRYKQAVLGAAWAIIQPVAGAIAFTLLFSGLAGIEADGESYFVFSLAGFVVWTYFSATVSRGTASVLGNADLVKDVAFAKIVAPLSGLIEGLVDFAIGVSVLLIAAILAGTGPDLLGLAIGLPAATALLIITSAGPVLLFSASFVRYRDVGLIVGFGIELFLFISPVAYPPDRVPEGLRDVQYINPLASCLGLMRWAFAGSPAPTPGHILLSVASAVVLFLVGWEYFRAREREFVDII